MAQVHPTLVATGKLFKDSPVFELPPVAADETILFHGTYKENETCCFVPVPACCSTMSIQSTIVITDMRIILGHALTQDRWCCCCCVTCKVPERCERAVCDVLQSPLAEVASIVKKSAKLTWKGFCFWCCCCCSCPMFPSEEAIIRFKIKDQMIPMTIELPKADAEQIMSAVTKAKNMGKK